MKDILPSEVCRGLEFQKDRLSAARGTMAAFLAAGSSGAALIGEEYLAGILAVTEGAIAAAAVDAEGYKGILRLLPYCFRA